MTHRHAGASSPEARRHAGPALLTLLLVAAPLGLPLAGVGATHGAEPVGNVTLLHTWTFEPPAGYATARTAITAGSVRLTTTPASTTWDAVPDLQASAFNRTVLTPLDVIVLASSAPNWSAVPAWDGPGTGANSAPAPGLGDLDDDGDLDLMAGHWDGTVTGLRNTGTLAVPVWTSEPAWDIPDLGQSTIPSIGDLDDDGDLDLIIAERNSGRGIAYQNNGTSASPAWSRNAGWDIVGAPGSDPKVSLGDLDADGDLDGLQCSHPGGAGCLTVRNTGNATVPVWSLEAPWLTGFNRPTPELGDLDGDGDLDAMIGDNNGRVHAYRNTGTAQVAAWTAHVPWDLVLAGGRVNSALGDLDSDGDLDLLVGEHTVGTTTAYRNIGPRHAVGSFDAPVYDAGTPVLWGNVSWNATVPLNTGVAAQTRTGPAANPAAGGWTGWSLNLTQNPSAILSRSDRYLQARLWLSSLNSTMSPAFASLTIGSATYRADGTVTTPDVTEAGLATDLVRWDTARVRGDLTGGAVQLESSTDSGASWRAVPTNGSLAAADPGSGALRLRATLTRGATNRTPVLDALEVDLTGLMTAHHLHVDPGTGTVEAGGWIQFTAVVHDINNRSLSAAVNWSTDIGAIAAGNLTAPARAGTGSVTATLGALSATATVTVTAAPLSRLRITPANATLAIGETVAFTVRGEDRFGNAVAVTPVWTCPLGRCDPAVGATTNFTAGGATGDGTVSASYLGQTVQASVTVLAGGPQSPRIVIPVPNQLRQEDSDPWLLNLTPHSSSPRAGARLSWYLEGVDTSLYSVTGELDPFQVLAFRALPDAAGTDRVVLWLTDELGFRVNQTLWVNLTPVDDAPRWSEPPDLVIHYDADYTFNYSAYLTDVDTPLADLSLAALDVGSSRPAAGTRVSGLAVAYRYPESQVGQIHFVDLSVSDGSSEGRTTVGVTVSADWPPGLVKPLPDVLLREGENRTGIFDLDEYFTDQDNDTIFFSYGAEHVTVTIRANKSVDMEAPPDWNGAELVTFRGTDPTGALVEDLVVVTVVPVNDPPLLAGVPDLVVRYDLPFLFDVGPYADDRDTEWGSLILTTDDPYLTPLWRGDPRVPRGPHEGLVVEALYPRVLAGETAPYTVDVLLTLSDGASASEEAITVRVIDDRPPTIVARLQDLVTQEDSVVRDAWDLDRHFSDVDGDTLTFTVGPSPLAVDIDPVTHAVTVTPPRDWTGFSPVTFRATDPQGALVEDTAVVIVTPVNDAPTLQAIPPQSFETGRLHRVDLSSYMADVDDPRERLSIEVVRDGGRALPAGLDIQTADRSLLVVASKGGSWTIHIRVKDPHGASVGGEMSVTARGTGTRPDEGIPFSTVLLLLLLLLALAVAITLAVGYRAWAGTSQVVAAFILTRTGKPICHRALEQVLRVDDDVFAGMLSVVTDFVEESLAPGKRRTDWRLRTMGFREYSILMEPGRTVILALVFRGQASGRLTARAKKVRAAIEEEYGSVLAEWDGDRQSIRPVEHALGILLGDLAPVDIPTTEHRPRHEMAHGHHGTAPGAPSESAPVIGYGAAGPAGRASGGDAARGPGKAEAHPDVPAADTGTPPKAEEAPGASAPSPPTEKAGSAPAPATEGGQKQDGDRRDPGPPPDGGGAEDVPTGMAGIGNP